MKAAAAIVEILKREGVDVLFGYPRNAVLEAAAAAGIRPVIVGLHEIVENALSQITLAQLVGNEASVDKMFHAIQGIHRTIEPQTGGSRTGF